MSYYRIEGNKKTYIPDEKILADMGDYLIIQPVSSDAVAERIDNFVIEDDAGDMNISLPAGTEFNSIEPENRFNMEDAQSNTGKDVYTMGIESVTASNIVPKESSGYITKDIEIGNVANIELSVTRSNHDTSVEFYIIDGKKEIPILPVEETKIKNEKIFFGQKTRFTPISSKEIVIKLDGTEINNITFDELISSEMSYGNYTADYVPAGNPHRYQPKNTKIKLKIIERVLKGQLPSSIYSIVIKKYGADKKWSI